MKLNLTRRRATAGIATLGLAAAAVAGTGIAFSSTSAAESPAAFSALVLGVGDTEASRTLNWYSTTNPTGGEEVQLATKADFSDKASVAATLTANTTTEGVAVAAANGKANLNNLAADTTYYYRVAETGTTNYSTAYSFKTGELGNGDFQFLFFGDPQIGAGGDVVSDGDGWVNTMNQTQVYSPKAELFVSGGDQIDSANNETQWNNFLRPQQLRSIPWAATIGNHDNGGRAYDQHFALPSGTKDNSNPLYSNNNNAGTNTGGDYWFKYKGVLFIDLNSNAYDSANGSDPAHVAFVTNTINSHKGNAEHVVLVYHHSIYSAAEHTNDAQNIAHRKDFTKTFSDLGVDLVLQGHDHSYSRSYALKSETEGVEPSKVDAGEQPGQGTVVETKGGVVYVTANSASGSKYYGLGAAVPNDTTGLMKNDTLVGGPQAYNPSGAVKTRLAANSVENQEYIQTYIQVTVNEKGLQVKNIRAGDNTTANTAKLAAGKGGVNGAGVYAPVGSVVDQFDLFRNKADISEIVPPADTREVPGATTTVTAQPEPAPTVTVTAQPAPGATVTVTPAPLPATEVVPAALQQSVSDKITTLTKKVKKAKGAKKAKLKAQLAAYKAVQSQLK
jgi:hypothetical protein